MPCPLQRAHASSLGGLGQPVRSGRSQPHACAHAAACTCALSVDRPRACERQTPTEKGLLSFSGM
eukprot:2710515-Alexandrium_andersonii.AAC.1